MQFHQGAVRGLALGLIFAGLCTDAVRAMAQEPQLQAAQAQQQQTSGLQEKTSSRIFGMLPNNATVEGVSQATPISAGNKFKLAAQLTVDPYEFASSGFLAAVGQAENDPAAWGQGAKGYGRRYASDFGDQLIGNFMVGAILPTLFHQDPRYFRSGQGGFWRRAGYAVSRIAVTRGDSGGRHFNISEIAGNGIAAGVAESYRPSSERGPLETAQTWATQVGLDVLTNELREFWPDIRRKLFEKQ